MVLVFARWALALFSCSPAALLPYMGARVLCDFPLYPLLSGEGPSCTWTMTEKSNGVKSSPANNHNHHAPPAIKANGKDDRGTSSR